MATSVLASLSNTIKLIPARRFNFFVGLFLATAVLDVVWLFQSEIPFEETVTVSSVGKTIEQDLTIINATRRIALGLLVGAACLSLKRGVSFLLSAGSLLWVLIEYLGWHSQSYAHRLKFDRWVSATWPQDYLFWGGEWWSIFAFLAVSLLFVWELATIVHSISRSRISC